MRLLRVCLTVSCAFLACTGQPARPTDRGGPVGGTQSDGGSSDAGNGSSDAGNPAAQPDGGALPPDAGSLDAGSPGPDAGAPDAGPSPGPDAGMPDAGTTPVDLGETTWKSLLDPSLTRFYRWLPSNGRNRDPEGVFRMEGDVLHILGLPATGTAKDFGYIATWDEFGDYRLRLEQKWGTQTFAPRKNQPRDSGLLYHLHLPDRIWPRSVEFQIMEHAVGDAWMLSGTGLTTTVADVGASPPTFAPRGQEVAFRGGQVIKSEEPESLTGWTVLELFASGRDSAHVVNGRRVNAASDIETDDGDGWGPLSRGRIALQAEGAEVFYRNLQIRPLVYMPPPAGAAVLFSGSGLAAWRHPDGSAARWRLVDGAMEVVPGTGDLYSHRWFGDVRIHVEFQVPASTSGAAEQDRGNSGVYIQGRYEVQVLDSFGAALSGANDCGAIYGVKDADVNESFPPGIWQSYDILFRAPRWSGSTKVSPARITVVWNGTRVQKDVEVWG
ncbi:MAG: DUF1080 domain-containing protein, partial [Myxococcaceae bacterium]